MPRCPEWTEEWEHKWIGQLVVPVRWFWELPEDLRADLLDENPNVTYGAVKEYFG